MELRNAARALISNVNIDVKNFSSEFFGERLRAIGCLYNAFCNVLATFFWVAKFSYGAIRFMGCGRSQWVKIRSELLFVGYLYDTNHSNVQTQRLIAKKWAGLNDVLEKISCPISWMHIFVPDKKIKTPSKLQF